MGLLHSFNDTGITFYTGACGGNQVPRIEEARSHCISWQHGESEWRHYATTEYFRQMGQAAVMSDGSIPLLGGQYEMCWDRRASCDYEDEDGGATEWVEEQTVEKVTPDGRSEVVFTLLHGENVQSCAVQPLPGGEVILLGGGGEEGNHNHVERYDQTGHLGSLPDMLQPRSDHACGFFNDANGNPVLLVAGGSGGLWKKGTEIATAELLLPGASVWIQGSPLPKAEGGVRAASHSNGSGILLTGTETAVLRYSPEREEWEEVGATRTRFWMHATVAGDLASLCQ